MTRKHRALLTGLTAAFLPLLFAAGAGDEGWLDKFDVPRENFASMGKNDFFILEPGYQLTLEGKEKGKPGSLIITVLDDTKKVDGVETRIVEERESVDGKLVEVSRNYYAVDKMTNDVYYFGEEVDIYKNGKISAHEGAWESGKDGAHFGLFMPAKPTVGMKHYQELAPKVAMDRAEVVSVDEKVKVPAGDFERCLKTRETTPLEEDEKEHKYYAPGVGLLIDEGMKLVKYGKK